MTDKRNRKASDKNDADRQENGDMLPEYNLDNRQGERGKYYEALQQGYTVRIHEEDGTTSVYNYQLEKGAVLLDPDVREYFPDAKAVNAALRSLIALIPRKPTHSRRKTKNATIAQR